MTDQPNQTPNIAQPATPTPPTPPAQTQQATARPQPASKTAGNMPGGNWMNLGRTQGQRSAEIVAGIRASASTSYEVRALARLAGQIQGQIIKTLAKDNFDPGSRYLLARSELFQDLIAPDLSDPTHPRTLVEIAAGFAPNGLFMARQWPHVKVIEVDLADVVTEKQQRLKDAKIDIPPNLTWRTADLGVTPLIEVLKGTLVDVVAAEGLMMYFSLPEAQQIARYVSQSLAPGGMFVFDIGLQEAYEILAKQNKQSMKAFMAQAGNFPGIVKNQEEAVTLLKDAGYDRVVAQRPSVMAERFPHIPKPMMDMVLIMAGYKPISAPISAPAASETPAP